MTHKPSRYLWKPPLSLAAVILCCLMSNAAVLMAGPLDGKNWHIVDANGNKVTQLTDGSLATGKSVPGSGLDGLWVEVDLGKVFFVHRFHLNPGYLKSDDMENPTPDDDIFADDELGLGEDEAPLPGMLTMLAGESRNKLHPVAKVSLDKSKLMRELRILADRRFQPVKARYIRFMLSENGSGLRWFLAEIELYGFPGDAVGKKDVVVLPEKAAAPLALAAEELSYYLGELAGHPIPIERAGAVQNFSGTKFVIEDLAAVQRASREDIKNTVNVLHEGKEVRFRAWPYRNVLYSVWEFLRRQGVIWVAPGAHGDHVPVGKGIDLALLPLHYTPSAAAWRHANFPVNEFSSHIGSDSLYSDNNVLFHWRNGYDTTWGNKHRLVLGGNEAGDPKTELLPVDKRPPEYAEGFTGYPHNFMEVIPPRLMRKHPDWIAMRGDREKGEIVPGASFCTTSPGAIDFVIAKALALTASPESTARIDLLPMDATSWCQCDRCQTFDGKPASKKGPDSISESYYYFVDKVARGLLEKRPHVTVRALAYQKALSPPERIEKFTPNVEIQICSHLGARNLPSTSKANLDWRNAVLEYDKKCQHLAHYSYDLLVDDSPPYLPQPLVTAMIERLHFLGEHGALNGGTQGSPEGFPYAPWNHYAYGRLLWDNSLSATDIMDEFFPAYFGPAARPMLLYYKTLEEHLLKEGIAWPRGRGKRIDNALAEGAFTIPVMQKMAKHLKDAEQASSSWLTRERVHYIREGFTWAVRLNGAVSGNPDDIPVLTLKPETAVKVTAKHAAIISRFCEKKGADAWLYRAQGLMGIWVSVPADGILDVTVIASGNKVEGEYPTIIVNGGRTFYQEQMLAGSEAQEYTFQGPLKKGTWKLFFACPRGVQGGKRHLNISGIELNFTGGTE